jgi:hypothetical protein
MTDPEYALIQINCSQLEGNRRVVNWQPRSGSNGRALMECATFREWLADRGCRFDHHEHHKRGQAQTMVIDATNGIAAAEWDRKRLPTTIIQRSSLRDLMNDTIPPRTIIGLSAAMAGLIDKNGLVPITSA